MRDSPTPGASTTRTRPMCTHWISKAYQNASPRHTIEEDHLPYRREQGAQRSRCGCSPSTDAPQFWHGSPHTSRRRVLQSTRSSNCRMHVFPRTARRHQGNERRRPLSGTATEVRPRWRTYAMVAWQDEHTCKYRRRHATIPAPAYLVGCRRYAAAVTNIVFGLIVLVAISSVRRLPRDCGWCWGNTALPIEEVSPLCQKPPSPTKEIARLSDLVLNAAAPAPPRP